MKSKYLGHSCWAAAVVAAFFAGSSRSHFKSGATDGEPAHSVTIDSRASLGADELGAANSAISEDEKGGKNAMVGWSGASSPRPLSEADIEELGRKFKDNLDPIERRLAFARMLEGLTVENAPLMREQIAHLDNDSSEFREFHYAWGAIGGVDAVLNGADTKERDMAATLAGWASADPNAAIQWLNGLDKDDKSNSRDLRMGMVHGLANNDANLAADFVFELAGKGDKRADDMLGVVTRKVLQRLEPAEAGAWAATLPDGKLRASAMDRIANDYVDKDPKAAAAWAEQFAGQDHNARVIEEVGDEWAERDPAASVEWLESLEGGKGKSEGLRSALSEWVKKDPLAASEYLVSMPLSPERDSAISGFVSRLAWEDPASAITWADEISDQGTRNHTLVQAGQALFRRDAEAAKLWLPSSGLSAEAQQKVLSYRRR